MYNNETCLCMGFGFVLNLLQRILLFDLFVSSICNICEILGVDCESFHSIASVLILDLIIVSKVSIFTLYNNQREVIDVGK